MRHDIVFPRLVAAMDAAGIVAVISGDEVSSAPWLAVWTGFKANWLTRLGKIVDPAGIDAALLTFEGWMDVGGSKDFAFTFAQPLPDFIACQHSRATWSRAAMGERLAREFDAELSALLAPHLVNGNLQYQVTTRLTWGRPRASRLQG